MYGVLSLKKVSKRRLEKILKAAKSGNLDFFQKFGYNRIMTSNIITDERVLDVKRKIIIPGEQMDESEISFEHRKVIKGETSKLRRAVYVGVMK